MPATMGATVSRPNAGSVHSTSGKRRRTGSRRARVSAARRRSSRPAAPTRSSGGPRGAPLRTCSARARNRGRPAAAHRGSSDESASTRGTPARVARWTASTSSRSDGGAHRARTGRAAGMVRPAPTVRVSRSTRSGRSDSTARWSCRRRWRVWCQRRPSAVAAARQRAGTGPNATAIRLRTTPRPARRSAGGCGRRPRRRRHHRPMPSRSARPDGRRLVGRRDGSALIRVGACRPGSTSTMTATAAPTASAFIVPAGRDGSSMRRRRRRG